MRFADFEIDEAAGILRRSGERVKLQDLPFRVLVVLVQRAGTVVTRDELRAALWGAETFVDAEAGLNTAIAKLREALGDSADAPRFIETLPKRGYRFSGSLTNPVPAVIESPRIERTGRRGPLLALLTIAVGVAAIYGYMRWTAPAPVTIAVVRFHNETGVPENDRLAESLTDAVVVSLAENARYGVIGNSPVLRTERMFEDVGKIGAALHAEYVILGQLQSSEQGLVARTHFIRVSDLKHVWAGTIDLGGVPDAGGAVSGAVAAGVAIGLARSR